ncbi:hypothetical protein [Azospirillum argentinense]
MIQRHYQRYYCYSAGKLTVLSQQRAPQVQSAFASPAASVIFWLIRVNS